MEAAATNRINPLTCMGALSLCIFVLFYKILFEVSGLSAWNFVDTFFLSGKHVLLAILACSFFLYYERGSTSVILTVFVLFTTTLNTSMPAIFEFQDKSLLFGFLASWHWLEIIRTLSMTACILLAVKVLSNPNY